MMLLIFLFTFTSIIHMNLGHGHMYYPLPWHASNDCGPEKIPSECEYDLMVPLPEKNRCMESINPNDDFDMCQSKNDLSKGDGWFRNFTCIPGEPTLPTKMYGKFKLSNSSECGNHPWLAPGTAPVWGEGCGANGGNPNGCDGLPKLFGRCCGGKPDSCGGYAMGKSAMEHYKDGLFQNAAETTWVRGKPAEVYWTSGMGHRGGYSYRLCKVKSKVWTIKEECFKAGHLQFYGNTTWQYLNPGPQNWDEANWEPRKLVSTTKGTNPPKSQWAKVNVKAPKDKKVYYWAIKDLVMVPENLAPGKYILSFRWDCEYTPQVFSSCANIRIVKN